MNKKIIVKEIDKFNSNLFEAKIITEYLIYYVIDGINVEAYTELGETAKNNRINELVKTYFTDSEITIGLAIEFVSLEENNVVLNTNKMEKQHPLIIVFYLDAEMMKNPEIIQPFAESVNSMLAHKESNALAFFIPTTGQERVECINPVIMPEADMAKITKMVDDIKEAFAVNADIDVIDEEITLDTKCDCDGGCERCGCDGQ